MICYVHSLFLFVCCIVILLAAAKTLYRNLLLTVFLSDNLHVCSKNTLYLAVSLLGCVHNSRVL